MRIINKNEFDQVISSGAVLVDFYADWCGPCKMLGPVLEGLSKEYEGKVEIVKVNVDNDGEIAQRFGIMSIPTLILFKDGQQIKQVVGFQPKPALVKLLEAVL